MGVSDLGIFRVMEITKEIKVISYGDNRNKSEKSNRGKVSLNDTVQVQIEGERTVEGEAGLFKTLETGKISVRDFLFNDEFQFLGNAFERTRLLAKVSGLPVAKSLSYYLNALFKRSMPNPAVYGLSGGVPAPFVDCNGFYNSFEVDFPPPPPPAKPLSEAEKNFRFPDGIPMPGLKGGLILAMFNFPVATPAPAGRIYPFRVSTDKYILGGETGFDRVYPGHGESFLPKGFAGAQFSIHCLDQGVVHFFSMEKAQDAVGNGSAQENPVTTIDVKMNPVDLERWGIDPSDAPLTEPEKFSKGIQTFLWSLITGQQTMI